MNPLKIIIDLLENEYFSVKPWGDSDMLIQILLVSVPSIRVVKIGIIIGGATKLICQTFIAKMDLGGHEVSKVR